MTTETESILTVSPHDDGVLVKSLAPGPYREGPAWIWLEKKDAVELAGRLEALDVLRDADEHGSLFRVGVDAEGKAWSLSAMRFRRYDEWWVQLTVSWNREPNHGAVQFNAAETVSFGQALRKVTT